MANGEIVKLTKQRDDLIAAIKSHKAASVAFMPHDVSLWSVLDSNKEKDK